MIGKLQITVLFIYLLAVLYYVSIVNIAINQPSNIYTPSSTGLDSAVGNTPLLELRNITRDLSLDVKVYAKAEWFNPGGSIKDRAALSIMNHAIENGDLDGNKRLLDSTSGNMGIAYATLGAALGVKVTLAIPSNASPERFTILKALGAEIEQTDPLAGSDGALFVAKEMYEQSPEKYFFADQYNNPANWEAHYRTTGPEIWEQTEGEVTHFIAGLGTTGTITGNAKFLQQKNPDIQIIAFQPDSPFHGLEGLKHMPTAIKPGIYDPEIADRTLGISTEDAYEMTRQLAREEGMFVGVSSGAAAVAALQVAAELDEGHVVTVFPDAGYKYLSEKFWELSV